MPMMARNDVGGTSTHNLNHWSRNMRNNRFADYSGKNYDTSGLEQSFANTSILLFIGKNDVLAQPDDYNRLLPLLPST